MKNYILNTNFILFLILTSIIANAQTGFEEHSITINVNQDFAHLGPFFVSDIDSDGDMDIIYTEYYLNGNTHVNWLENIDGQGNFFDHYLFTNFNYIEFIVTADIDNDNDQDIILSTVNETHIILYKSINGVVEFEEAEMIEENTGLALTVITTDIDNDGDIDIVVPSLFTDEIILYKNVNGLGDFNKLIISNTTDAPKSVYPGDIDQDGDMDIFSASNGDENVSWHENIDGLGNSWTKHIINSNAFQTITLSAADLDADGDLDVIYNFRNLGDHLIWEKNDGSGNFNYNSLIYTNNQAYNRWHITFDKDNDEKIDVISASDEDNKIAWYKNEGICCEEQQVITNNATNAKLVWAADINMDGRTDVISVSRWDGVIYWHENVDFFNVDDNDTLNFEVFPNPSDDILYIDSDFVINQIDIYNVLGQIEATLKDKNEIDVSKMKKSVYFLKVTDLVGNTGFCKIVKN